MIQFYKMRVSYFYGAKLDQVDFEKISEEISSRTNQLVRDQTDGRVDNMMKEDHLHPAPPFTVFAANYFEVNRIKIYLL